MHFKFSVLAFVLYASIAPGFAIAKYHATSGAEGTADNYIFRPNNIGNGGEYLASVAPYNAFCPLRCPDEVVWPRSEDELVKYLQDVQKRNASFPITVRGGGHSYTCQSTSSVGAVIDMRRFKKLELRRLWNDQVEATVGAGLVTGEITGVLDQKGWSLPHGICSTVGLAGWLLNAGDHPLLENFKNYYGVRDFVTEIRGVTLRGSVLRISETLPQTIEIVSRSPYEPIYELETMISNANLLGQKINTGKPGSRGAQGLFRKYGANMFIATEFKMEVRQQPEPLLVISQYPGNRLKHFHHKLEALLDERSQSSIACWLALYPEMAAHARGVAPKSYPSLLQLPKELLPSIEIHCVSWKPSSVESICNYVSETLQETPSSCFSSATSFPLMTQLEGFGWYPWFTMTFVPSSSESSLVGRVIDFVYDLHTEANCSMSNGVSIGWKKFAVDEEYMNHIPDLKNRTDKRDYMDGSWLVMDLWFGDDVEWKEECISSTKTLQKRFHEYIDSMGLPHRSLDTHLPDCTESKFDWRQQLYGSNYGSLAIMKQLWDPQSQLSFFRGIAGTDRNAATCADQFVDRSDTNCVAAGVNIETRVGQTRKEAAERTICSGSQKSVLDGSCLVKSTKLSLRSFPMWMSSLDPKDFRELFAWLLVIVMTLSALVFEWYMYKQISTNSCTFHTQSIQLFQTKWRLARVMFPPLQMVALLAIPKREPYGILLFAIALWKFGFPELTVYTALVRKYLKGGRANWEYATYNFFTLIAMLAHHISATVIYVFTFVMLNPFDQQCKGISLLVVSQHLFTNLMGAVEYGRNKIIYVILIAATLGSEIVLQVECLAYAPVANSPVSYAVYLFSASHYLLFAVGSIFLFRHGDIPTYYMPPAQNQRRATMDVMAKVSAESLNDKKISVNNTSENESFEDNA